MNKFLNTLLKICERILLELYALEESKPFHKVENYIAVAKVSLFFKIEIKFF